jgi:hypothetical protein
MNLLKAVLVFIVFFCVWNAPAQANAPFRFESIVDINDMTKFISQKFPLGIDRDTLRRTFVTEGGATLVKHPSGQNTEKYIYDINFCEFYVWRWNISADYDETGKLQQAYMNGIVVFPDGVIPPEMPKTGIDGKKAAIIKIFRPRPEARKGEDKLAYLALDRDGDPATINDQRIIGSGPSRADAMNFGTAHFYKEVDPWRSIFDADPAEKIVPAEADCVVVETHLKQ